MATKEINPKLKINAEVEIPGSKSYTNRALLISALADGNSELSNVLFSDDTKFMIEALKKFGVAIERRGKTLEIKPKKNLYYDGKIFVGNAGTAMRFLTGFCALGFGAVELCGSERMNQRPIGDLVSALNNLIEGVIETKSINAAGERCPPVLIKSKKFNGGKTRLKGNTSSQYLSSILMVAPYAENDTEIETTGELTSKPYADMTIDIMGEFGVEVKNNDYKNFFVKAGQKYKGRNYRIECDASNISYFIAAAAISAGRVKVKNINPYSIQGDIHFLDLLEKMGCKIFKGEYFIEAVGPQKLKSIEADMNAMPDTAQTLAVLASVADGTTKIYGIGNLREKETDRINALEAELGKVGIKTESTKDSLTVYGGNPHKAEIETYNDHRMAMSFSVLGLKIPGIKIKSPGCVSKSFPEFYEIFDGL